MPVKKTLHEKFLVIHELAKKHTWVEVAKKFGIEVSEVSCIWDERLKYKHEFLSDALWLWYKEVKHEKSVRPDNDTLMHEAMKLIKDMELGELKPTCSWCKRWRRRYGLTLDGKVPSKLTSTVESENGESPFLEISDSDLSCAACLPDQYLTSCKWDVRDKLRSEQRLAIIDDALLNWFNKIKHRRVCISHALLCEKVKEFVIFLNFGKFYPSHQWFNIWRYRHKIPLSVSGPTIKFGLFRGKVEVNPEADVSKKSDSVVYELKDLSSKGISNNGDPNSPSSVSASLKFAKCNTIPSQENLEIHNCGGEQKIFNVNCAPRAVLGYIPFKMPLCEKFLVIQELEKKTAQAEVAKKFNIELSEVASIWEERNKSQYKWLGRALQSWYDDPKRDKSVQVDTTMLRRQTKIWIEDMYIGKKNKTNACYQHKHKLNEESLPVPLKKTKVDSKEGNASPTEISDSDLSCAACLPDGYLTSCKWDVQDKLRSDQCLAIIDDALLNWFNKIKRTSVCVNSILLRDKVKEFIGFFNYGHFHPSCEWLDIWRNRHNVPRIVYGPTKNFGLFRGKVEVNPETEADVSKKRKNVVSSETPKDVSGKSISNDPIGPSSVTAALKCDRIPLQEKLDSRNFGAKLEGDQVISDMDRALLAWYNDAASLGEVVSSETLLEKARHSAEILCYDNFEPPPDFPSRWKKRFGLLENISNPSESTGEKNEVTLSQSDMTVTEEEQNKVHDIASKFEIDKSDVARIVKREKKAQKIVKALKMTSLDDCNLVLKELYKKKKTYSEIALSFKIPETTVTGIWEHRLKLLAADNLDDLDAYLLCWYNKCNREQSDVNDRILLKKAKHFAKHVKKTYLNLSKDWVKLWRKRCGLRACKKNLVKKVDSNSGHDFEPPSKRIRVSSSSHTDEKTEDVARDSPHRLKENHVCSKSDQVMVGKNSPLPEAANADTADVPASANTAQNHNMEVPQKEDDIEVNLYDRDPTLSDIDDIKPKVIDHKDSNTHRCNEKVLDALCTISGRLAAEGIDTRNFLKLEKQVLDNILENACLTN